MMAAWAPLTADSKQVPVPVVVSSESSFGAVPAFNFDLFRFFCLSFVSFLVLLHSVSFLCVPFPFPWKLSGLLHDQMYVSFVSGLLACVCYACRVQFFISTLTFLLWRCPLIVHNPVWALHTLAATVPLLFRLHRRQVWSDMPSSPLSSTATKT